MAKNKIPKPNKLKIFTALDTGQSAFVRPMKGRQFKLARTRRIKNK